MSKKRIAVIAGDGIGKELMPRGSAGDRHGGASRTTDIGGFSTTADLGRVIAQAI